MAKKVCKCRYCDTLLSKDEVGLTRKLLENEAQYGKFTCLKCMAEIFDCTVQDLQDKIEDFKEEGCKLFS